MQRTLAMDAEELDTTFAIRQSPYNQTVSKVDKGQPCNKVATLVPGSEIPEGAVHLGMCSGSTGQRTKSWIISW